MSSRGALNKKLEREYNEHCRRYNVAPKRKVTTINLIDEQYEETSNYFGRLSADTLSKALKKLMVLGTDIKQIPTACGSCCYLICSKYIPNQPDDGYILFIPPTVRMVGIPVHNAIQTLKKLRVRKSTNPLSVNSYYLPNLKVIGGENTENIDWVFSGTNVVLDITDFCSNNLESRNSTFRSFCGLVDMNGLNTSNVVSFKGTFVDTFQFSFQNNEKLDTSSAETMREAFSKHIAFNIPEMDTSKVKDMSEMFSHFYCENFEWTYDTSSCTDMSKLFKCTYTDNLDVSRINYNPATNYDGIFDGAAGNKIITGNQDWLYELYKNRERKVRERKIRL